MPSGIIKNLGRHTNTTRYLFYEACHNSAQVLVNLPGQEFKFPSNDTGATNLLRGTAAEVLMLKAGCKVLMLFNINHNLKNGTFGTFIEASQDNSGCLVHFPKVGVVTLPYKTWYKCNPAGVVQAT